MTTLSKPTLLILDRDPNRKGDLFSKVARDLFHSLGYSTTKMNLHKAGREIDLLGHSRAEGRRHYCAECKATKAPVGGDDINKFVGVLDAEQRAAQLIDSNCTMSGFFVSLSGFTDSAAEQETALGNSRVTLIDGCAIVDYLVEGRIVVSLADAAHAAARVAQDPLTVQLANAVLVAHDGGFAWAIPYNSSKSPSHCAFVHADGTLLSVTRARTLLQAAKKARMPLAKLAPLGSSDDVGELATVSDARRKYLRYVEATCGEIQLDGLPADEQVGAKKLKLEHLFVPMHLSPLQLSLDDSAQPKRHDESPAERRLPADATEVRRGRRARSGPHDTSQTAVQRMPFGEVISTYSRIAILAAPGGGKSTLLKRIAVAYGIPERRPASHDNLPTRSWLPLFVRCRDLGQNVRASILTSLYAIADRAELDAASAEAFKSVVGSAIRGGSALLLIDGLDEIADEGDRVAFATSLRTFLATYANVALVVTSREAGFRAVAGAMAAECERFRLAEFNAEDIKTVVLAWHKEVYGEGVTREQSAVALARDISTNDRIHRLAGNPLLLTTLLLVKRWVGQLPNKRTVLYEKAIEVLLATWNVQAHAPVSLEEAMPRLEFVAFTMLAEGLQSISRPRLQRLLHEAREALPETLAYSQFTDSEFIDRIELRSSLLVQAGHSIEDGHLEPVYEFRHLTFQEYLVARAIVNGHYAGWSSNDSPTTVLASRFTDAGWREVVSMTAVMAGRDAKNVMSALVAGASAVSDGTNDVFRQHIAQCLIDDVPLAPADADVAMNAALGLSVFSRPFQPAQHALLWGLSKSRYGGGLANIALEKLRAFGDHYASAGSALGLLGLVSHGWSDPQQAPDLGHAEWIRKAIESDALLSRTTGWLATMELAFNQSATESCPKELGQLGQLLPAALRAPDPCEQFVASWAAAWLGGKGWRAEEMGLVLSLLSELWGTDHHPQVRRQAAWATANMAVLPRDSVQLLGDKTVLVRQIELAVGEVGDQTWPASLTDAALVIAYYLGEPWQPSELAERIAGADHARTSPSLRRHDRALAMLAGLGQPGERWTQELLSRRKAVTRPARNAPKP